MLKFKIIFFINLHLYIFSKILYLNLSDGKLFTQFFNYILFIFIYNLI
jgi:hypothetical protein